MPGITEVAGTLNAQAKNTVVIWYQHVEKWQPFNVRTGGVLQDVASYVFRLAASVSEVRYENKKLTLPISEPLVPQPTISRPRIIDSAKTGQKIMVIPSDLYLLDIEYGAIDRPAVITDIVYTKTSGEENFFRYTIIPFRAGEPS